MARQTEILKRYERKERLQERKKKHDIDLSERVTPVRSENEKESYVLGNIEKRGEIFRYILNKFLFIFFYFFPSFFFNSIL